MKDVTGISVVLVQGGSGPLALSRCLPVQVLEPKPSSEAGEVLARAHPTQVQTKPLLRGTQAVAAKPLVKVVPFDPAVPAGVAIGIAVEAQHRSEQISIVGIEPAGETATARLPPRPGSEHRASE